MRDKTGNLPDTWQTFTAIVRPVAAVISTGEGSKSEGLHDQKYATNRESFMKMAESCSKQHDRQHEH